MATKKKYKEGEKQKPDFSFYLPCPQHDILRAGREIITGVAKKGGMEYQEHTFSRKLPAETYLFLDVGKREIDARKRSGIYAKSWPPKGGSTAMLEGNSDV